MNAIDLFLCAVSVLDTDGRSREGEATAAAHWVATACEDQPTCVVAAAVIWGAETGRTFTLTPTTRHAFGPMQVTPGSGKMSGQELKDPATGFAAGVRVWGLKVKRAGGVGERAFRYYNGHPRNQKRYGENAWRRYRLVVGICGQGYKPERRTHDRRIDPETRRERDPLHGAADTSLE